MADERHDNNNQEKSEGTIMKVTIENLGAIQNAEINLKPLTVLIGPNNAGKTWLAYTLAGIFGANGRAKYVEAYTAGILTEKYPPLDEAIEKVLADGIATLDLVKFAEQYGEKYFQCVSDHASQWMPDFMSTRFSAFDKMKIFIDLAASKARFLEHVKQSSIEVNVARETFTISKRRGSSLLQAITSTENDEEITEQILPEQIRKRLIRNVMQTFHQSLYTRIAVFPTERTDLVTLNFQVPRSIKPLEDSGERMREALNSIIKGLDQLQDLSETTSRDLWPREPLRKAIGPVGYFLSMLSAIFRIGPKEIERRAKAAENDKRLKRYIDLSVILERDILAGSLAFSPSEPNQRREILFNLENNIILEMPIVSSMVKELSSLVLYLRYLAQPDELLIIDEPEMNLHPEAQVKMIEFLCMLVKAGLRVLITTHSTFMVDHLVNLMQAARYPQESQEDAETQDDLAERFFLKTADAFIPEEHAAVYLIDQGTAENVVHDAKIDWGTFGEVSDRVSRIYFSL
jgi:ABC-type cobalamin/Fe3+-siderophores transport system ATPase subunit